MPKGKQPGTVSGNDAIVKAAKYLSWGKVAELQNAPGSHAASAQWVRTVLPWFATYYENTYGVPLTDKRLANLVATWRGRYESWPNCERVERFPQKAILPNLLTRAEISEAELRQLLGLAPLPESGSGDELPNTPSN
jgi:hypothetical protein